MHVGRSHRHIAQAGRGEGAAVDGFLRHLEPTQVGIVDGEPVVAELMIGEERSAVAVETVRAHRAHARLALEDEQLKTALLLRAELRLAAHRAIEFRVVRGEREQVVLDGEADALGRDRIRIKSPAERLARGLLQFRHDAIELLIHLQMICDRHERLRAQRRRATVPKELALPREIEERHPVPRALAPFHSEAEATRIGKRKRRRVARRARQRAVPRQRGVVEKFFAERHTLGDQRVVPRQRGDRKGAAGRETIRREFRRQVERLDRRRPRDFRPAAAHGIQAERAGKIRDERGGDRIVLLRVSGCAVLGERDRLHAAEQRRHVEADPRQRIAREIDVPFQHDRGAIRIAREMIRITRGRRIAAAPVALQREENVAASHGPVEAVQIGVQRVLGRILRGVRRIHRGIEPDVKTQRRVPSVRHLGQRHRRASPGRIHPCKSVLHFQPRAIRPLQRESTQQIAGAGDRKTLTRSGRAAQRVE